MEKEQSNLQWCCGGFPSSNILYCFCSAGLAHEKIDCFCPLSFFNLTPNKKERKGILALCDELLFLDAEIPSSSSSLVSNLSTSTLSPLTRSRPSTFYYLQIQLIHQFFLWLLHDVRDLSQKLAAEVNFEMKDLNPGS
ncbi:hypothetical protein NC653_006112 [Populus alba x Populus x berolinensis]|uniref:Uncharacterized protein n=1 Tax=Populus alba x Populus x berolinensis TaxID=444605 RepID=A0AAD6WCP1_9ROSI|nr:hypothetical protein NC653_006112 [Populus alba x Populus x berolinensis]